MDGTCQICGESADIKTWPDGDYCWKHYDERTRQAVKLEDQKTEDHAPAN